MRTLFLILALAAMLPQAAHAWWDDQWTHRTKVSLNTTSAGVEIKQVQAGVLVPVRLHSGNFDFLSTKPDGSDLRVVSSDDKTPLKFWVERFDGVNELALIWVQVPSVLPETDQNHLFVYAGNEKAPADTAATAAVASMADAATVAIMHFAEKDGVARDHLGQLASVAPVTREANGLLSNAAVLTGDAIQWPASEKVAAAVADAWSVSLWVKPKTFGGTLYRQGPMTIGLDATGKVVVALEGAQIAGAQLPVDAWAHLAVTAASGKLTLLVNGAQAGQADVARTLPIAGEVVVGEGATGLLDQLVLDRSARSEEWFRLMHAAHGADAKLIMAKTETADSAESTEGGEPGHFSILVDNLTVDAWVIIIILGLMFVVAAWVTYSKSVMVSRWDRDNRAFLERFRDSQDVMKVDGKFKHSPLARLYAAGLRELVKRDVGDANRGPLSGASINAVKAAIDADLVSESHVLNSRIVLLTIAISGGPFLGLLGTVVGVMITFAAIAAAGDVNVNAIAPGIAAALLATVAGLAVAIPALFAYNYLASRIKNISSDMQIFVDEFVTRVAESYGAP